MAGAQAEDAALLWRLQQAQQLHGGCHGPHEPGVCQRLVVAEHLYL